MKVELVATADLAGETRGAMFGLLERFFAGVDEAGFAADLGDKDYALLLRDVEGELRGFTTLALRPDPAGGGGAWVLYSGDTIVDAGHRSSTALAAGWIDAVERLKAEKGIARLVWLLICSSVRTYHFLPLFFREFAPHPERPTPPEVQAELDRLAGWRYGSAYDPTSGIVRLPRPQTLRAEPEGAAGRRESELAAFFARANPGHAQGDELACHCEIADTNLTAAGRRMVAAGPRRRALG